MSTKTNTDFDWDDIDPDAQDAQSKSYPLVIWRNGKSEMEDLGATNVNFCGGLFFGYEYAGDGATIKGWVESNFKGEREKIFGLAAQAAHIIIVRGRKRWFRENDRRMEFRPWNAYEPGFRAQYQGVGFVKGHPEPVCFTFKGRNVDHLKTVLQTHAGKLVALANKEAPDKSKRLPGYAIWMPVRAGKHEMVGQGKQSEITPPEIGLPKVVDLAFVRERYIGRELLIECQELYCELDGWAREWDIVQAAEPAPTNGRLPEPEEVRAALSAQAPEPHRGQWEDAPPDEGDGIPF